MNYTNITLNAFSLNSKTRVYSANITVHLVDAFGLDKGDVRRFQNSTFLNAATGGGIANGFNAWWLLQHNRGYVPFTINVDITRTISGTLK